MSYNDSVHIIITDLQTYYFFWHLSKTMPLRAQYHILKSCEVFCANPKEVDPTNLNLCMTNTLVSVSTAPKYIIKLEILK